MTNEFALFREPLEFRANDDGTVSVQGYAAKFNTLSHPFGNNYYESIAPGAFTRALNEKNDVNLLVNHEGLPLASTKSGTLQLSQDSVGLRMNATLDAQDPDVQKIVPKLKRGDLSEMSFGFMVSGTKQSYKQEDGKNIRQLDDVNLYDVSVVSKGQYPDTSVKLRSFEEAFKEVEPDPRDELKRLKESNKDLSEDKYRVNFIRIG